MSDLVRYIRQNGERFVVTEQQYQKQLRRIRARDRRNRAKQKLVKN